MRDLFRFLYKIRNTLFFLMLMGFSYAWTITGNEHHRSQAVGTANTAVGRIYAWRADITEADGTPAIWACLFKMIAVPVLRSPF